MSDSNRAMQEEEEYHRILQLGAQLTELCSTVSAELSERMQKRINQGQAHHKSTSRYQPKDHFKIQLDNDGPANLTID